MWFILKPEPKPTQTPAQLQLHELQELHRRKVYQEALVIEKKKKLFKAKPQYTGTQQGLKKQTKKNKTK